LAEFRQVGEKTFQWGFDRASGQVNHSHSRPNLGYLGFGIAMVAGEYVYIHAAVA
jgi:hypothetical protein